MGREGKGFYFGGVGIGCFRSFFLRLEFLFLFLFLSERMGLLLRPRKNV